MRQTRSNLARLYLGSTLLVVTGFGSIFAGNILGSANNNKVEFGAGEFYIKSCNTWISLNILAGSTGTAGAPSGLSPLSGLEISGLDTVKCRGTRLVINSESKSRIAIPVMRTDHQNKLCQHAACVADPQVADGFAINIDSTGQVALENQDQFRSLEFDATNNSYIVHFLQPASLAADAQNFIIQSEDGNSK